MRGVFALKTSDGNAIYNSIRCQLHGIYRNIYNRTLESFTEYLTNINMRDCDAFMSGTIRLLWVYASDGMDLYISGIYIHTIE